MADTTASLAMQFGVAVVNPLNVDGYSTEPYLVGGYSLLNDIGVQSIRAQSNAIIEKNISLLTQYTVTFDIEGAQLNQVLVTPTGTNGGGNQYLAELSHVSDQHSQYTHFIENSSGLRNSFAIRIDRDRPFRNQIRFIQFEENPVRSQFFFQSPFFVIHEGQGYAREAWPSFAWPFVSVVGSKFLAQYTTVIVGQNRTNSQFNVAVKETDYVGNQISFTPVVKYPLFMSFYMPCVDEITNGRPQYNMQFDILRSIRFHNEVRWRPF